MRFCTTAVLVLIIAVGSSAAPVLSKRADIDAIILQYALTLEHLENAFYKKALSTWTLESFVDAGLSADLYNELKFVTHDEQSHVTYLTAGLTAAGAAPVEACTYDFPMSTPQEFVKLASMIEGVGVSAYLGAAPLVTSSAYLTAAGSILVTEAIHQSTLRGAADEIPMANPYGTPLGFNAVYSIASLFITDCPSTNMALPVMALPALTVASGMPTAIDSTIDLKPSAMPTGTCYATFCSGLMSIAVPVVANGDYFTAVVPAGIEGQSYVFLTSDNSGNVTDASIVAGPSIIEVTPSAPTFDVSV
ncbi:ferritin-like domain-containing protein, partial [Calycina marina]